MGDFREIADTIASDIASGRLRPGERLPPQREFAYRRGIAASTASRVYAELSRRGLILGEVGRGTYIRSALAQPDPALTEPTFAPLDLELNFPLLPEQAADLLQAFQASAGYHPSGSPTCRGDSLAAGSDSRIGISRSCGMDSGCRRHSVYRERQAGDCSGHSNAGGTWRQDRCRGIHLSGRQRHRRAARHIAGAAQAR